MSDTETVLEESEDLDGTVVQTVQRADGIEYERRLRYTCSICGAPSDRPFPPSSIDCMRSDCRAGEEPTR